MKEKTKGYRSEFGEYLKMMRIEYRLTQEELSKKTGVNITIITRLENGLIDKPRYSTIEPILNALNISKETYERIWNSCSSFEVEKNKKENCTELRMAIPDSIKEEYNSYSSKKVLDYVIPEMNEEQLILLANTARNLLLKTSNKNYKSLINSIVGDTSKFQLNNKKSHEFGILLELPINTRINLRKASNKEDVHVVNDLIREAEEILEKECKDYIESYYFKPFSLKKTGQKNADNFFYGGDQLKEMVEKIQELLKKQQKAIDEYFSNSINSLNRNIKYKKGKEENSSFSECLYLYDQRMYLLNQNNYKAIDMFGAGFLNDSWLECKVIPNAKDYYLLIFEVTFKDFDVSIEKVY